MTSGVKNINGGRKRTARAVPNNMRPSDLSFESKLLNSGFAVFYLVELIYEETLGLITTTLRTVLSLLYVAEHIMKWIEIFLKYLRVILIEKILIIFQTRIVALILCAKFVNTSYRSTNETSPENGKSMASGTAHPVIRFSVVTS